ncbi:nuclear transport factor 2 family protein [Maricaulis sp. MIT060901]|uniref:nuclear transport factor 2 family protein n=1 Tax=Maricaulis sp. MIT060901 TaxID=3096993 RepID=UPI00399BF969
MRRTLVALCAGFALSPSGWAEDPQTETALRPLAETFAHGFYSRDADMVLSVVHPELSKIGVWSNFRGTGVDITEELPPGTLRVLGQVYNYDNRLSVEHSTVGVDFFDSTANVGVFQLTADTDWYDFFLGTHINGQWVLVNCAYGGHSQIDNPNRAADMADVHDVVMRYAAGWDTADYDLIESVIYQDADRRHVVRGGELEFLQHETLEMVQQQLLSRPEHRSASQVMVFEANRRTAAARINAPDRSEWVFLQRLNDEWKIVNMFWEAVQT